MSILSLVKKQQAGEYPPRSSHSLLNDLNCFLSQVGEFMTTLIVMFERLKIFLDQGKNAGYRLIYQVELPNSGLLLMTDDRS